MADKKAKLILFKYDDGSIEVAEDGVAEEVMAWLNSSQSMAWIHGARYAGRKMELVRVEDLESIASIAKRVFPEEVKEISERRPTEL